MREARNDPEAMQARAARAHERVLADHDAAQVAERYAALYERTMRPADATAPAG